MAARAVGVGVVLSLAGCVTERSWEPGPPRVTTAVYDENGREVANPGAAGFRILGLGPRRGEGGDPLAEFDPQDGQDLSPQERQRRREAAIRNTFGSTVLIRGDLVTKRYFLTGETGAIFLKLLGLDKSKPPAAPVPVGGEKGDRTSILGGMLGDNELSISFIANFEQISKINAQPTFKGGPLVPVAGAPDEFTDLVLVTAKAPALAAFEDALNLFYSNIPQVEIEVKVVEFSTTDSLSFGTGGTSGPGGVAAGLLNNLSSGRLINKITSQFPISPPAGSGLTSKGLLSLGGIHDGWELDMTLEALQAQGQADILSSPRLTVRNGGTAWIATFTDFPFPAAQVSVNAVASTSISFKPVGVSLGIKPVIAGTQTVILQIHADVSAVTGFSETDPISAPIISKRSAITQVHVPDGKSTIIGGLKTKNVFNNETKIPVLGDIPILGYLFRATTEQTSETELKFIITPRIKIGTQEVLAR